MAYIGLRKPIVAKRTGTKKYGDPFAFGKAIALTITPNYSEGSLNADDAQAEYDKIFNYAEMTMGTNTIPVKAHEVMFGHTVKTEEKEIDFNAKDEANYIGVGWITVEKIDGKQYFTGNFIYKAKFTEPSEDYETKGDSITYKTPSISGRALEEDDGDWKSVKVCDTEEDALKWIKEKFGTANTLNAQPGATKKVQ